MLALTQARRRVIRQARGVATQLLSATPAMLIVALVAPAALAQTPSTPSPAAAALEKAVAAEPADAVLTYFLAVVRAQSGDAGGALAALEQTLERGNGFLPPDDIFESLGANRQFRDLRAQYARKLPRVVTGNVVATMSDPLLIPEGLAYDGAEGVLYVGSIARRGIYRIGGRGKLEPLSVPADELDAVLGLAVDERGRKLYAVSTSALTSAGRTRPRNAVVVYDLRTDDASARTRSLGRRSSMMSRSATASYSRRTRRAAACGVLLSPMATSTQWCPWGVRRAPTVSRLPATAARTWPRIAGHCASTRYR